MHGICDVCNRDGHRSCDVHPEGKGKGKGKEKGKGKKNSKGKKEKTEDEHTR